MLAAGDAVVVSPVVLAELTWCSRGRTATRGTMSSRRSERLIDTPPFVVQERAAVVEAIALFEKGAADFADYLILGLARAEGASALLTFDKRLLKTAGCQLP
ncbi:MAG: PIN domain-containing protein [Polyangiaceae bacterium]|nr:PIN domain-containing protein [Polyangiaceae bacterium]